MPVDFSSLCGCSLAQRVIYHYTIRPIEKHLPDTATTFRPYEKDRAIPRQVALYGTIGEIPYTLEYVLHCPPCLWSDNAVNAYMLGALETLDSVKCVLTENSVYAICRTSGPGESDNVLDGDGEQRPIALRCLAVVTPGSCGGGIAAGSEGRTEPQGGGGEHQASKQGQAEASQQQEAFPFRHLVSFVGATSPVKQLKTIRPG